MHKTKPMPSIQERVALLVKVKMEGSIAEATVATAALEVISELRQKIETIKDATLAEVHIRAGGTASEFTLHGKTYKRMEFATFDQMEAFFVSRLLGTEYKSKVIGKTLIYWQ